MGRSVRSLFRDSRGAVAATVALSLIALIATGGIAFDYARLAGLHTELQQAADQAALAAATQLDRQSDAITRADKSIKAPANTDRLAANYTRFANDSGGATVNLTTVYCSAFDDSKADSDAKSPPCTTTTDATKAQFIVVTTTARVANYALTPIVAAFSSGDVTAKAVAGVQSSVCDIAPLVVCAPSPDFPSSTDIGKGLVLKPLQGTAGNYGLLDFGSGAGGAFDALIGFGLNGCQSTSSTVTEPGTITPVTDAINTRLDVYNNKNAKVCSNGKNCTPQCDLSTGNGCPAPNARKDMIVQAADKTINTTTNVSPTQAQAVAASATCPADSAGLLQVPTSPVAGFPRDTCHYGTCAGSGYAANIGDGVWDRQAYFNANHPGLESVAAAAAKKSFSALSRYDVYSWESTDASLLPTPQKTVTIVTPSTPKPKNNPTSYDWTIQTQCGYPAAPSTRTAYPKQKDRRVLPIVAADCSAISGKTSFAKFRAFDVFLTEPSADRTYPGVTNSKEIYAEIKGPSTTAAGGSGFQYYSRNKPYLVR